MSMGPFLPSFGLMGAMGAMQDPVEGKHGKSIARQHMGSPIGRRQAGRSQITGGDQGSHSMGHYGKKGLPGLTGGDL